MKDISHTERPSRKDRVGDSRPSQGETLPVQSEGSAPQLPHERDESAASQKSEPRKVIEQAGQDLARGIQDSDLGPPMDDTYHRTFHGHDKDRAQRRR